MNDYNISSKYLKNKKHFSFSNFIKKLISKILGSIVILLVLLIVFKIDKNNNNKIYNYMTSHNISFASINNTLKSYIGKIFPSFNSNDIEVFNEKISYSNSSIYHDGVSLTVSDNYLVPIISSGVVVFVGEKEGYGNCALIQNSDGIITWYGSLTNINVNIYDYVSAGEFLGEANNNTVYLAFQKDGEFLDYKKYIS